MTQRAPASVGDSIESIETPALVLDLALFERNVEALASAVAHSGLRLRPHAKSHKCPEIAKTQIARGAIGICCQKTDEAIAFIEAGIADVLVTNEVIAPAKLQRLAESAKHARVGLLVDSALGVRNASHAAREAGVTLDLYVEIDVGANRCGVAPEAAGDLAQLIASLPAVNLAGLQCYHGSAQHLRTPQQRADAIASAAAKVRAARHAIERVGLGAGIVTGAGTGTWPLERSAGIWDELQPGSYVFMDADYGRNVLGGDDVRFEQSLFVLASVISVPAPERAVVDAGLKALAFDSGLPLVHARPGLRYAKASDEHGVLEVAANAAAPALGELVWLVPGHCDPTVNLYDWIVGIREGHVGFVWPIAARGALA